MIQPINGNNNHSNNATPTTTIINNNTNNNSSSNNHNHSDMNQLSTQPSAQPSNDNNNNNSSDDNGVKLFNDGAAMLEEFSFPNEVQGVGLGIAPPGQGLGIAPGQGLGTGGSSTAVTFKVLRCRSTFMSADLEQSFAKTGNVPSQYLSPSQYYLPHLLHLPQPCITYLPSQYAPYPLTLPTHPLNTHATHFRDRRV